MRAHIGRMLVHRCRCCKPGQAQGSSHSSWNIYQMPTRRRLSEDRKLLFGSDADNDGLSMLLDELMDALPGVLIADDALGEL